MAEGFTTLGLGIHERTKQDLSSLARQYSLHKDFIKAQYRKLRTPKRFLKYAPFLLGLSLFKYFDESKEGLRFKFLESYYAVMRHLDDVADVDALIPTGFTSRVLYLEHIKDDFENPNNISGVEVAQLLKYCLQLGLGFGEDFTGEAKMLIEHMIEDAKRKDYFEKNDTPLLFPTKVEYQEYVRKEVESCMLVTIRLLGEEPETNVVIGKLAYAVMEYYSLRDLKENIANGFVDISIEEMKEHGGSENDFSNIPTTILTSRARIALDKISRYEDEVENLNLKKVTSDALNYMFKRKAKKFLLQIAQDGSVS